MAIKSDVRQLVVLPYLTALGVYFSYSLLYLFGHIRDFYFHLRGKRKSPSGYAPITSDDEAFYTRNLYHRIQDCWNRPICSAPDAWFDVMDRTSYDNNKTMKLTGTYKNCLNLGSYNYLGFAASDPYCTPKVIETVEKYGWSTCSSRMDAGTTEIHTELEALVAEYVGKEDAIVYGMGFATNSVTIPSLVGPGCLVLSDSLNHTSIVAGVRASGAKVKIFRHNDANYLEKILRDTISEGQPRTHRPWKKILIIVEGIYSMEGEVCALREIVEIKKKYKAYLYLDEAHSIGALGRTGRGACEYCGVDPKDVDIMMGTFTKSFGSCGGYIAGDKDLIQYLRCVAPGSLYATAMSPPAVKQVTSALQLILGEDGSTRGISKIKQLHDNANWFREELKKLGLDVLGDEDSPVMPIMLYSPGKIGAFSRYCLERNVAVVVVGFPATPLLLSRSRVCISAAHSREDLEFALQVIEEAADACQLRYDSSIEKLHG